MKKRNQTHVIAIAVALAFTLVPRGRAWSKTKLPAVRRHGARPPLLPRWWAAAIAFQGAGNTA